MTGSKVLRWEDPVRLEDYRDPDELLICLQHNQLQSANPLASAFPLDLRKVCKVFANFIQNVHVRLPKDAEEMQRACVYLKQAGCPLKAKGLTIRTSRGLCVATEYIRKDIQYLRVCELNMWKSGATSLLHEWKKLTRVKFNECTDFDGFEYPTDECKGVHTLSIADCHVPNMAKFLLMFPNLQTVRLSVVNIDVLPAMCKLRHLALTDISSDDSLTLSNLRFARDLQSIKLLCCDLKELPKLPDSIKSLHCEACDDLDTLPDMANCANLSIVNILACKKMKNFHSLGSLPSLEILTFEHEELTNDLLAEVAKLQSGGKFAYKSVITEDTVVLHRVQERERQAHKNLREIGIEKDDIRRKIRKLDVDLSHN
jgi:hypothetical protein